MVFQWVYVQGEWVWHTPLTFWCAKCTTLLLHFRLGSGQVVRGGAGVIISNEEHFSPGDQSNNTTH
jgi:hypothetical protein